MPLVTDGDNGDDIDSDSDIHVSDSTGDSDSYVNNTTEVTFGIAAQPPPFC